MHIHPEFGTIDSPMNVDEVDVFPFVPQAIRTLNELGYELFIATNQPAAAKGKTTKSNLERVHQKIMDIATSGGGKIRESYICWALEGENHPWRKPRPGMLLEAQKLIQNLDKASSWMVGDGVVDIKAGKSAGLKTAFIGPDKCYNCKIFLDLSMQPDFSGNSLRDFVEHLATLAK
jgi:D-glycero-D-manno-heptose 1,7-bisphosphate phosphatase